MARDRNHGLIHYSVRRERGNRHPHRHRRAGDDIFLMIVREGLQLSVTAFCSGLRSLLDGSAGSSLLFGGGVTATDPLTFTIVSLLLTVVAVAAFISPPAAHEGRPTVALRQA